MKFSFLNQIIQKIQKQLHCPHCKSSIDVAALDVNELSENEVKMTTPCNACGRGIFLNVAIETKAEKSLPKRRNLGKVPVPETLDQIRKAVPLNGRPLQSTDLEAIKSDLGNLSSEELEKVFKK